MKRISMAAYCAVAVWLFAQLPMIETWYYTRDLAAIVNAFRLYPGQGVFLVIPFFAAAYFSWSAWSRAVALRSEVQGKPLAMRVNVIPIATPDNRWLLVAVGALVIGVPTLDEFVTPRAVYGWKTAPAALGRYGELVRAWYDARSQTPDEKASTTSPHSEQPTKSPAAKDEPLRRTDSSFVGLDDYKYDPRNLLIVCEWLELAGVVLTAYFLFAASVLLAGIKHTVARNSAPEFRPSSAGQVRLRILREARRGGFEAILALLFFLFWPPLYLASIRFTIIAGLESNFLVASAPVAATTVAMVGCLAFVVVTFIDKKLAKFVWVAFFVLVGSAMAAVSAARPDVVYAALATSRGVAALGMVALVTAAAVSSAIYFVFDLNAKDALDQMMPEGD